MWKLDEILKFKNSKKENIYFAYEYFWAFIEIVSGTF